MLKDWQIIRDNYRKEFAEYVRKLEEKEEKKERKKEQQLAQKRKIRAEKQQKEQQEEKIKQEKKEKQLKKLREKRKKEREEFLRIQNGAKRTRAKRKKFSEATKDEIRQQFGCGVSYTKLRAKYRIGYERLVKIIEEKK